MQDVGRFLLITGCLVALLGALLSYGRLPFAGKLPGDILITKKNFTFYFPLTTSLLASLLLTLVLSVLAHR